VHFKTGTIIATFSIKFFYSEYFRNQRSR